MIGEHTRRIDGLVAVSRSIGDFFMQPYIIDDAFVGETQVIAEVCMLVTSNSLNTIDDT